MHDIVIRGDTILDGTGVDGFNGDVAIDRDKLAQVGGKAGSGKRARPGRLVRAGR